MYLNYDLLKILLVLGGMKYRHDFCTGMCIVWFGSDITEHHLTNVYFLDFQRKI